MTAGAPPPQPTPCSTCGAQSRTYFRVVRGSMSEETTLTHVCSLPCLGRWLQQYAALQGARLVYGARNAIESIKRLLKGSG